MGFLPFGFLGVDVFFVISGYLITKIVYQEVSDGRFSIVQFYLRRTRRIIPLVLVTCLVALMIGIFVMLPDDLENLSQSIIATNLFANNILLLITTGNYWDIVNDYKPLMHTWSLGVEEQFYLLYPIIFFGLGTKYKRVILPIIILLSLVSLILYFGGAKEASKFYSIQYRFFELSLGGIGAIMVGQKVIKPWLKLMLVFLLTALLVVNIEIPTELRLIATVVISLLLLLFVTEQNFALLSNPLMVWVGKISFSLYMWHQVVLSYARYVLIEEVLLVHVIPLTIVIFFLSAISFHLVEQPFRNKAKIKNSGLLVTVGVLFLLSTGISFYIYLQAGVVRDVPELNIIRADNPTNLNLFSKKGNPHSKFNARIYELNKPFSETQNIKVLVVGNSFARDWANVLLCSKFKDSIEVSYIFDPYSSKDAKERFAKADYIHFSEIDTGTFNTYKKDFSLSKENIWVVGTKNFGHNNGLYFNQPKSESYCKQRVFIGSKFVESNNWLKNQWYNRYIDLIGLVANEKKEVPIFTPDCKFISQDCRHFTEFGAEYFGNLLDQSNYSEALFE